MPKKEKILIIEDEVILTQALEMYFSVRYEVVIATDGEMGYNIIQSENIDIILLDIFLPKLNGFDLLKKVKKDQKKKHIPVIILSNLGGDKDIQKGLKLGAAAYLVKANTDLEDIVRQVEKIINRK